MAKIPHIGKQSLIRGELMKCATASPMEFPTYNAFAPRVGMPVRGPWKGVLDAISRAETQHGLPDITFVLVNSSGFPSQIGFMPSKNADAAANRARASRNSKGNQSIQSRDAHPVLDWLALE